MNKEDFIGYIKSSKLSDKDKELWEELFSIMDDQHFMAMADFVDDKEENLVFITNNIKAKKQAFANNSKKNLNEIYRKEREYLTKDHE